MKRLSINLYLIFLLFVSCQNTDNKDSSDQVKYAYVSLHENRDSSKYDNSFMYKKLDETYLKEFSVTQISSLFGKWVITEIADVGGSLQKENIIIGCKGNEFYIDENLFKSSLPIGSIQIKHPKLTLLAIDTNEDNTNLRNSTFIWGYRPCREKIYKLVVNDNYFFEIIYYNELAYYADGRIFFLRKK